MNWIKIHRKFLDWEWYSDSKMVHLFIHLLLNANFKDSTWQGIEIKRGQMLTGILSLYQQAKISHQSIRTCLKKLKSTGEITIKSTNKYSIITICKYEEYQSQPTSKLTSKLTNDQQTTNKQSTSHLTTIEEYKEGKNEKNKKNKQIPALEEFLDYAKEILKTDFESLKNVLSLKYESWKVAGWRTGGKQNREIKNWKSTLLNTIPYLEKEKFSVQKEKKGIIDNAMERMEKTKDILMNEIPDEFIRPTKS